MALQTEEERNLGIEGLANGLSDLVSKMGSKSAYFHDDIGYMEKVTKMIKKTNVINLN